MNRRSFLTNSASALAVTSNLTRPNACETALNGAAFGPPGSSIVIDAHAHCGYMGMYGQTDVTFEDELAAADEAGIDKICISSIEAIEFDAAAGNKAVYELMKRYPDKVIGFATVPSPYFGKQGLDEIERAVETYGMKGVGEVETSPAFPIDIPQWIEVLERAAELKIPVLVHGPASPCSRAAERVPEATIILAHIGTGWGAQLSEWLDAIEMARKHPNLYLETCTSITSYGQIEMAIEAIGAERVIFGTDSPLLDPAVMRAKIDDADISDAARQKIMGANMARLLRISAST